MITFHIGPMFSGKTTALIANINKHSFKHTGETIMFISKIYNKKVLKTHDEITYKFTLVKLNLLTEYKFDYTKKYLIGIDEFHFFNDIDKTIELLVKLRDTGSVIFIAGLSSDYERKPFEIVSRMIPHTDKLIMHTSFCNDKNCNKRAIYSSKLVKNNKRIEYGSEDKYVAMCNEHYC